MTYRLDLGPGESRDVIFTAPSVPKGEKRVYSLFDRNYGFVGSSTGGGYGGMRTQIHVYGNRPALIGPGDPTLGSQDKPNALFAFNNYSGTGYPSDLSGEWTFASGT